jgi:hypothetical protein
MSSLHRSRKTLYLSTEERIAEARTDGRDAAFAEAIEKLEKRVALSRGILSVLYASGMNETAALIVDQTAIIRLCIADIRALANQ